MSLTKMLMGGYSSALEACAKEVTDEIEEMAKCEKPMVNEDPTTESWGDMATAGLVSELYTIENAYLVADVIGEVKVIKEGASPEALLEAMNNGLIDKIKAAFKKFWAKIKSWFESVKRFFKLIFLNGKKFITEFKSELNKKTAKGYIYSGYNYDLEAGRKACEEIEKFVEDDINAIIDINPGDEFADLTDDKAQVFGARTGANGGKIASSDSETAYRIIGKKTSVDITEKDDSGEIQDKYAKAAASKCGVKGGTSDVEELRTNLTAMFRGGADEGEYEEFEDFEGKNDKSSMIAFIETFDKELKDLERKEKKFDTNMNKIIKKFDDYKPKAENDKVKSSVTNAATRVSKVLTALLNVWKVPSGVQQAIMKEAESQFERALKGYLRFKPAKESFDYAEESFDLLDQAMTLI